MIDRLPDELVLAIFEELAAERVSGGSDWQCDDERVHSSLADACCVSRRLCKIAQPVLWRRVIVNHGDLLDELVDGRAPTSLGHLTQQLVLKPAWCEPSYTIKNEDLGIALIWPNIVELVVDFGIMYDPFSLLDPQLLASHACAFATASLQVSVLTDVLLGTGLRRLTLNRLDFPHEKTLPTLPTLEELSITHCDKAREVIGHWVSPSRMPSLRILHVASSWGGERYATLDTLDDSIFAQLDVVRTPFRDLGNSDEARLSHERTRSMSPPVLVDYDVGAEGVFRHTLFPKPRGEDRLNLDRNLIRTAKFLESDTTVPPAVFVLPWTLQWLAYIYGAGLDALEEQCAAKGWRIIWYDDDDPFSFVPPEFVRYARELKAERRAREQEEQEVRA